jgi:hypothetical protein
LARSIGRTLMTIPPNKADSRTDNKQHTSKD